MSIDEGMVESAEGEAAVVFEDKEDGSIVVKSVSTGKYSRIFVRGGEDITMESGLESQRKNDDFDLDTHLYYRGSKSSVVISGVSEGDKITVVGVRDDPEIVQTYEV